MTKSKTMLAILGSPRTNGNMAAMLHHAMNQAEAQGYKVQFIDLYGQKMAPCRGCMRCKQTGVCVIQDDVQAMRQALLECDLLVMACPTYFANVTAPVKNLFDRLVATVMDDNNSMIPKPKLSKRQKYILMTACSTPFPFDRLAHQSTGCLHAMDEFFHISGMTRAGTVVFAGTKGKQGVPEKVFRKIDRLMQRTCSGA